MSVQGSLGVVWKRKGGICYIDLDGMMGKVKNMLNEELQNLSVSISYLMMVRCLFSHRGLFLFEMKVCYVVI